MSLDGIEWEGEALQADLPRYCPRCRREAGPGSDLCALCGEAHRDQSYCQVCERFWMRPAGTDCPKHDVPLGERPPAREFDPAWGPVASWVTVGTFADAHAASAAGLRLEAEGIPTVLEGERMGGRSMYLVATGGVKLQVPPTLSADARVLLSQSWSLPAHEGDDLDDAWDDLAPDPGSDWLPAMTAVFVVSVIGPLVLLLVAWLAGQDVAHWLGRGGG